MSSAVFFLPGKVDMGRGGVGVSVRIRVRISVLSSVFGHFSKYPFS